MRRIQVKVLIAILVIALPPLFAAVFLVQQVVSDSLDIGVNQRVKGGLERSLDLYRDFFRLAKENFRHVADQMASNRELMDALEGGEEGLAQGLLARELLGRAEVKSLAIEDSQGRIVAQARGEGSGRTREMVVTRPLGGDGRLRLKAAFVLEEEYFDDFEAISRLTAIYGHIDQIKETIQRSYSIIFSAILGAVVILAASLGLVFARRMTKRVLDLHRALAAVASGDLTVQVPVRSNDEIGTLTRGFNDMVHQLRESRARIGYLQKIGAWQEVARRLAHEIKNPLTPILLAVQQLHSKSKGQDPAYQRLLQDTYEIVTDEVGTLRRLVEDFSAFARLPQAMVEPTDLGELVGEFQRGQGGLELEVPDYAIPVALDRMLMKRVLVNLVDNARAAIGAAGREEPRIVITLAREGGYGVLEVRDNGAGVREEDRERIFDPYFTTRAEGTGLGLAIVKKIVLEHSGEIAVVPAAEGGAAFIMRFPLTLAPLRPPHSSAAVP